MENYKFSTATLADIPKILALYDSLRNLPNCAWDSEYPNEDNVKSDIAQDSLYKLTDEIGQIVATISATPADELGGMDWDLENPCEVARLGVLPSQQNKGLGGLILRHTITEVQQRGFDGIIMLVNKGNPAALALYKKNGFLVCGEGFLWEVDFFRLWLRF